MLFIKTLYARIQNTRHIYIWGMVILVIISTVVYRHAQAPADNSLDTSSGISHVQTMAIKDLSAQAEPLPVTGKITSLNQATILSQSAGEIVSLPHTIGSYVPRGTIIAQLENSSQRAAVLQAQGAYDAAQAALTKAKGSTAANSDITSSQASLNAQNATASLKASLQSMYAALDDAIHTKADSLFDNPRGHSPTLLNFTIPDSQLVTNIQNERALLEKTLEDVNPFSDAYVASATINQRVLHMNTAVGYVETFLNRMITAINQAVPNQYQSSSDISAAQTSLAAARTEVVNAFASLTSTKAAYDSASSSAQTAENSASTGTQSDIAAAEANLKSALGSLEAMKANLDKTIIRSSISGTIVSLPVSSGDYVSAFSQIAVVSNPSTLEIKTYVTPLDAQTLSVGNKATIGSTATGTIASIAPAIDPANGKILVKIDLAGSGSLTDGDTVTVSLERTKAHASAETITIPITATKITPQGPIIFTISSSTTLLPHPITLGTILGGRVVVLSGTNPDMQIVTDARGLSSGDSVVVDPHQ